MTPREPLVVSVVIPCYKRGHFLGEAIESVLAQSYPHYEIVVVDDGSTDNITEVAARYPGVRCTYQYKQGLAAARNTGIRESNGSYLVFLDAGDRLLPEALEAGIRALAAHPGCAFVSGRYREIAADGTLLWELRPPRRVERDHYVELLRNNYIGTPATVMYRRSVLESVGGFDTSLKAAEDYELYLRIARDFPSHCHGKVIAEYRSQGANMMRESALALRYSRAVLRSQWDHIKGNKYYEEAYGAGMAHWRGLYRCQLGQLVGQVQDCLRGREWEQAVRSMLVLLQYYPQGFAVLAAYLMPKAARSSIRHRIRRFASAPVQDIDYQLVYHIRAIMRTTLPFSSTVIIFDKEDDELLQLEGRQVWGFSPTEGRRSADACYPTDSAEALARFEALRTKGGDFLLVPSTAFWWLEHYCREFKQHLDTYYRRIWSDEQCIIYQLSEPDRRVQLSTRALVVGWFSFEYGHATAGDLLARDVVCEWLECAGYSYDIALAPPFRGGVDWQFVDPNDYSHVVFVCGPFQDGTPELQFLDRFASCRLIGLDLSMLVPLSRWNPFDFLLERDSSADANPDLAFCSRKGQVPVVGVCLVEPYESGATQVANAAVHRLVASREMSVVNIDTRLDTNSTGLRSPAEVESLLARMDVVVTTRLHGTVLALKNGVPVIAIDPEAGGAKIRRQAETIGWPIAFNVDALTDEALKEAFAYCMTEDARTRARECSERAIGLIQKLREEFVSAL